MKELEQAFILILKLIKGYKKAPNFILFYYSPLVMINTVDYVHIDILP